MYWDSRQREYWEKYRDMFEPLIAFVVVGGSAFALRTLALRRQRAIDSGRQMPVGLSESEMVAFGLVNATATAVKPKTERPAKCVDCAHYRLSSHMRDLPNYGKCHHPDVLDSDQVAPTPIYCDIARRSGVCGPKAKLFTPVTARIVRPDSVQDVWVVEFNVRDSGSRR